MLSTILFLIILALCTLLGIREYQQRLLKNDLSHLRNEVSQSSKRQKEISLEFEKLNNQVIDDKFRDRLTGLPNLSIFEDRTQQVVNYSKRYDMQFAVMVLDIDQFSVINNKLGYTVGDKLLAAIAKRLQGEVRQVDTLATLGSGKFLFLLPQLAKGETAAYVAQRMQDAIIRSFNIEGQELYIRANMGIAVYPADGDDTRTLLKNAEQALNMAKQNGNHSYQFHHQPTNELGKREVALKALITSPELFDRLTVNYEYFYNIQQAQVEIMQVQPALSLPVYGDISYQEMIRIATNNNRLHEIGAWLLNSAILQFQHMLQEKVLIKKLLIPVTIKQIQHTSFIPALTKALQEHYISPNQIIFEISDQSTKMEVKTIEETVLAISQLGVNIAVSILGMGHFAIQQITKIPVNYLKIDGKIIYSLLDNQESKFILNVMLTQATELKIDILAEGVDNEAQKNLLSNFGCETMQGKLFTPDDKLDSFEKTDAI